MHVFASGHRYHIITAVFFFALSAWWVSVQVPTASDSDRQVFSAIYGLMALWGAIWGIIVAFQWGGMKSLFGKAIFMFSIGLFLQEFGQLAYTYYANFLHIEIPYPSIGDVGYFGSIPFYILGAYYLAHTAGIKFQVKSTWAKANILLLPASLLVGSYVLFLRGYEFDWSNPLAIFLDFGYPLGQSIYISIALLTYLMSRKMLGGVMRPRVMLLLIAFLMQYLADFTFLYQNSIGTWSGGRLNDYMYLVAYTTMTLAILELRHVVLQLKKSE